MFKNLTLGIISAFLISCSDSPFGGVKSIFGYEEPLPSITFELSNRTDENGFIHITANPNVFQTLYRISGHLYREGKPMNITKMAWQSETNWMYDGYEIPIVNSSSYSRDDGEVNTMMAVIFDMLGDTIQINYGYYDEWKSETTYGDFFVIVD